MIYLMRTQNADYFLTTDDPELHYKWQLVFGGWTAFRTEALGIMEVLVWIGSEQRFEWRKLEYLILP